jgi:hypothetical protein
MKRLFVFLGQNKSAVFLNYFVAGVGHERTIKFDHDSAAAFHDSPLVYQRSIGSGSRGNGDLIPTKMQKIYISTWIGGIGWKQVFGWDALKWPSARRSLRGCGSYPYGRAMPV